MILDPLTPRDDVKRCRKISVHVAASVLEGFLAAPRSFVGLAQDEFARAIQCS
jgi:hypothetical protein